MTAPRPISVVVDWGLAYEALIGLALFAGGETEHTYDIGDGWFKAMRKRASPELRESVRRVLGKNGYSVAGLAVFARETGGRSVTNLVARIRRDRGGEVKRSLLHCDPPMRDAVLRGDPVARRNLLAKLHAGEREQAKRVMDSDPRELALALADVLERWDREIFSEIGPPLAGDLEASAQSISRLARQLPYDRLVVKATRGVEYRPDPWIETIVLIPSVLNRPWVDLIDSDTSVHIFYPASPGASTPDAELVEVYKALGDESRLRILRLLAKGETSLSEIAEKLGLAKSTVHGHMVILRTAGLTRSVVGGDSKGYVLNDRPDLNALLDSFLKG